MSDLSEMMRLAERSVNAERDIADLKRDLDGLNKGVMAFAQKIDQDKANTDAALAAITKQQDADRALLAGMEATLKEMQASLTELATLLAQPAASAKTRGH